MMWISTDTSQEPGAWSPERKGSDPWPLASGAAFIDVIINHADKGRLDFHFTPLTALPLPLLIPFPNPFPWHFFPSLCQYPRKPYFDSYGVAMAVTILCAFCVRFVCIIYVPHRCAGRLSKSVLPLSEMPGWIWMGTGQSKTQKQ